MTWYHSLAVFINAKDADVAAVVMAAGVNATADVQVDLTNVIELIQVLIPLGDGFGELQAAGIGQGAKITAWAGNHVRQQCHIGAGHTKALAFCHSANSWLTCTQGSITFWSWVMRASPAR